VFDFAKSLLPDYRLTVLAPHDSGAQKSESMEGVTVRRFRYWVTEKGQNIVYNGGALANFKKTPLYFLKVLCYTGVMFMRSVWITRRERIPIINPHWLIPQGFIAVAASYFTGAKIIVTIHGGDIFSFHGKIMRSIKRWVLKKADQVVVNSSATLEAATSIYGGREYQVIPMGLDYQHFNKAADTEAIRKRHGLDDFTILFVGRLVKVKGVEYLLESLKLLRDENHHFKALIVGEGPEREKLYDYAKNNGMEDAVEFVGWVDSAEIPAYYQAADVLVGPSIISQEGWTEALGLVFAEALASGTPVIATDTGGIKDIVKHKENGFLLSEKSAEEIKNAIKMLDNDEQLRKTCAENGMRHVKETFSWGSVGSQYSNLLEQL
jgi:glycosyltransferase involved in cell wall biosynthesis